MFFIVNTYGAREKWIINKRNVTEAKLNFFSDI